jgi:hypothetical protein
MTSGNHRDGNQKFLGYKEHKNITYSNFSDQQREGYSYEYLHQEKKEKAERSQINSDASQVPRKTRTSQTQN